MPDIKPDPNNARKHPDQNKALIRHSLEEVGAFRSIAVDGDGVIRAGNGVYEQAVEMGLKIRVVEAAPDELIAVQRADLTGDLAIRAAILDNRSGETSEWDVDILAALKEDNPEVVEGLWDAKEWRAILDKAGVEENAPVDDPGAQENEADLLAEKWQVERGQVWEIPSKNTPGKSHRLMCGDSTRMDDVAVLMAGQRALLFATDPPYLVDYDGTNHPHAWGERDTNKDWSFVYNDWDKADQGDGLYDGFVSIAQQVAITEDAAWYCWHASRRQAMVEQVWERYGAFVHQQIVWVKNRPILTRSWYMWEHEPCFFGWVRGQKPKRFSEEFLSTVWSFKSPLGNERVEHPTQKPIELFTIPMLQHTEPGDLCYEPFSGSGSQLVAAETVGRICFAMETSPAFVAVALERLAGAGLEPVLAGS